MLDLMMIENILTSLASVGSALGALGLDNRNPRVEPVVLRSPMATLQLHAELI